MKECWGVEEGRRKKEREEEKREESWISAEDYLYGGRKRGEKKEELSGHQKEISLSFKTVSTQKEKRPLRAYIRAIAVDLVNQ